MGSHIPRGQKMKSEPLVSIVVIVYNSSNYILETLNSITHQSYKNIELIISDDCSTDNTLEICKKWISDHSNFKTKICTSKKNTGISGNINRGVKTATGDWIKLLSGDDLLFEDSIERFLLFISYNGGGICVSRMHFFGDEENVEFKRKRYDEFYDKFSCLGVKQKFNLILKECTLPMPGLFISKKLFERIGFINEDYPFAEEWPTFVTILKNGIDIPYFDEELIKYRCINNSLSSDLNGNLYRLNYIVFKDSYQFFKEIRRPLMLTNNCILSAIDQTIYYHIIQKQYFTNSKLDRLWFLFLKLLSPLSYVRLFRKIVKENIK
jgi:alpha-1,3-rhamnosyltransferase